MKLALALLLLPLFACSVDTTPRAPLSGAAAVNATAISARQTADTASILAAGAQSNANSASSAQTAIAQVTADWLAARGTDQALAFASANETATATRVYATEQTQREQATGTATVQQGINQQHTAETALARQDAYATSRAHQANETATATRLYATDVAQATIDEEKAKDDAARRDVERQIAAAKAKTEMEWAPVQKAAEMFLPALSCVAVLGIGLIGLWILFRAFEGFIKAKSLDVAAPALAQMQIKDVNGNPLGYLQLQNGVATFRPYFTKVNEEGREEIAESPRAAIPLMDMQDRKMLEAPVAYNTLIGGFHYTTLLVFVRSILEDGDWTQATWCAPDKYLPRGFKLTTDTDDGQEGTYSRMLRLFTERNLIIERRHGAKGRWNPNAPTNADGVMAILADTLPPPKLPPDAPAKRSRRKQSKPIQTVN